MADAEIGALRVTLAMNAGEFERGAKSVGETVSSLGDSFKELGDKVMKWSFVMKAAMALTALLSVEHMKTVIESMAGVADSADKIRMPVQQFTEFAHAAEVAGVPMGSLEGGLKNLADTLEEVARGDGEQAAKTLTALGVSAKDSAGKTRETADVFLDLATKFKGLEDSAAKTTLATNLFGGSAENLAPLLNQGAEGLRASAAEARNFGLTMDTQTAVGAQTLITNMRTLGSLFTNTGAGIAAGIIPILVDFTNWLLEIARSSKVVEVATSLLTTGFRAVAASIRLGAAAFDAIQTALRAFSQIVVLTFNVIPDAMDAAWKGAVNAAISGMETVVNTVVTGLAKIGGAVDSLAGTNLGARISQSLSIDVGRLNTDEAAKKLEDVAARISAIEAKSSSDIERLAASGAQSAQAIMGGWTASIEDASAKIPKAMAPIIKTEKESAEAKAELNRKIHEGIQLAKALETPRETEIRQLEALKLAYEHGKISAEAMSRAQVAAAMTAQNAYAGLASNVMGSLSKLFEGNKAIAIASALVNTYESVTKALSAYPPPLSFVAAGAALAAGLAQVMNITKTTKNSSGGGGSSMTGVGGSAGMAGAGGGGADQANSSQMLMVKGLNPGQLFTGESVRDLAGQLLKFQKDGGEVVLA
jgi:hypothetical protein